METKIFQKGRIVRVMQGIACGNPLGTITKVLSKPGEVTDFESEMMGHVKGSEEYVLCEAIGENSNRTYQNKPCWYEHINDLAPATEEEKVEYRKSKKQYHEQGQENE